LIATKVLVIEEEGAKSVPAAANSKLQNSNFKETSNSKLRGFKKGQGQISGKKNGEKFI
jgi:hypothetical protein